MELPAPGPAVPDIPPDDPDASVPGRFERIVRQHADKLAVKSSGHAWTYAELNRIANRLAHALLSAIGPESAPVALLFEHDAPAIAGIFGVLKAGKFYASLDPSFPLSHNEAVLSDLRAPLLLCDRANLAAAYALAKNGCRLLIYDDIDDSFSPENPELSVTARTPLAVYYTSGSTRQPKGVLRNQNVTLRRVAGDRRDLATSPEDRQTLLTSLTFSASSSDINVALLNGASLHLYDIRKFGTAYLADWLRQEKITHIRPPVALFRHFVASLLENDTFPSMRVITLGGAPLFRQDIEAARAHFPASCKIIHRYSVSEAGGVARLIIEADTQLDGPVVPVGHPYPGKQVLILDEARRALPVTEVGEIAVRVPDVPAGYWHQPDQTRERYIPDPSDRQKVLVLTGDLGRMRTDGNLELLGRSDSRIKIRGFRVELTAVEGALRELDGVEDAVVTPQTDDRGETRMVAYVVPASQQTLDAGNLHRALATRLPDYMVPSAFVFLETLPLTRGGKVDRKALPPPAHNTPASAREWRAPQNPTEAALVAIWSEVLNVVRLGVTDNFFELGGHSLLAARVIAKVNEAFRVNLLLRTLYDAPTVAELAAHVDNLGRLRTPEAAPPQYEKLTLPEAIRLLGLE